MSDKIDEEARTYGRPYRVDVIVVKQLLVDGILNAFRIHT